MVSIPSDNGVTSNKRMSFTSPFNTPPCTAAPIATASSGFTSLRASLPKNSATFCCTSGIRVWPPTRIISWISLTPLPASFNTVLSDSIELATKSSTNASNFARVIFNAKCLGPVASAVM